MRRIPQLDILRGIAILLVLAVHAWPGRWIAHAGWVGVDLFFVLSGFLISGLLFVDIQRYGQLRIGRFLVRRGFKIYPPFYFLLLVTFLIDSRRLAHPYRSLAFFFQNYRPTEILGHTWSLAVEEHFYLALPLLLALLVASRKLRMLPYLALVAVVVCFAMRVLTVWSAFAQHRVLVDGDIRFPTHLRFDALLVGVGLGYLFHFESERWERLARCRFLLPIALLFLAPSLTLPEVSVFMVTWGLMFNAVGFGVLLVWALHQPKLHWQPFEQIGVHSYSIYLWHPLVLACVPRGWAIVGVFASLAIGITMSVLIEAPSLALRERIFSRVRLAERVPNIRMHTIFPPRHSLEQ